MSANWFRSAEIVRHLRSKVMNGLSQVASERKAYMRTLAELSYMSDRDLARLGLRRDRSSSEFVALTGSDL